jgi:hypothetical protein
MLVGQVWTSHASGENYLVTEEDAEWLHLKAVAYPNEEFMATRRFFLENYHREED